MNDKKAALAFAFFCAVLIFALFLPEIISPDKDKPPVKFTVIEPSSVEEATSKSAVRTAASTTASKPAVITRTTTSPAVSLPATTSAEEVLYVDINSAGVDELRRLKGIGEVLAGEIVAYREANGGFANIEEITLVPGIGEAIFADIRDYIYVVDPVYPDPEVPGEPEEPSEPEVPVETAEATTSPFPININEADRDELLLIPGVSEEEADAIIDVRGRLKDGRFASEYELLLVKGLTRDEILDMREYVVFD